MSVIEIYRQLARKTPCTVRVYSSRRGSLFVLYAPECQVDAWLDHPRLLRHFVLEGLLRVAASPEELTNWIGAERGRSEPVHLASEGEDLAADLKRGLSYVRQPRKNLHTQTLDAHQGAHRSLECFTANRTGSDRWNASEMFHDSKSAFCHGAQFPTS